MQWRRLLAAQDGVVSTAQALSCGWSRGAVHHRVRRGHWRRIAERVLVTSSGEPSARQLRQAGLLVGGPSSALTGPTACVLHALSPVPDARVHLAVPRTVRRSPDGFVLHDTRRPFVPLRVDGLRVVPAARADAAGRWLARPDVVFRARRLVVEVDGQRWHLAPERWAADVERHTRLEAAGWTVLRYPAARVLADADGVAAEVAAVARRRAA